jgi:flagellar motor protein MotB
LNSENGFAFVLLPLDAVVALQNLGALDGSDWPISTLAILSYERGLPTPTSESWQVFQGWAQGLQGHSDRGILRVTGHTDASGTDDVNAALSLARAEFVATQLQSLAKWPQERVEVEALGSAEPLGNDPAQNRRVEVRWVRSLQ